MDKAYHIKIYGSVQGVFFRAHAEKLADRLDLAGFARNEPDGSVYIEIEGSDERLDKFINWCREGSAQAAVERVVVEPAEPKHVQGFRTL